MNDHDVNDATTDDVEVPVPDDETPEQSALSKAAEQGPVPGIANDDGDSGEPIGRRPHDEVKEIIGFNGLR